MRKISNICTEFKQVLAELENAYCCIDSEIATYRVLGASIIQRKPVFIR
jgi:hypothetical protein